MEHMQIAAPVLASLNIDKTAEFYQKRLGFDKVGWKDKHYTVIAWDKTEIHFWKCNNKIHPKNTSCSIRIKNIDGLYEDGNMIKFGENIYVC